MEATFNFGMRQTGYINQMITIGGAEADADLVNICFFSTLLLFVSNTT